MLEELLKQIPVFVGGLLAIAGGMGSQALVHLLAEKREKAKLRREKLESLVKAVYAHAQWLDDKRNAMVFRNQDHDTSPPLDEARMVQALHFPELSVELHAVMQACIPMLAFIHQQRQKHMESKEKFIAEWDPTPYTAAYNAFLISNNVLVDKCRGLLAK